MSLFNLFDPQISIGFVPDMNPAKQHGVAWMKIPGDGVQKHPFTVDRPEMLVKPTFAIVDQLFQQIAKMGFFPDKIELVAEDEYLVYQFGKHQPIIRQRVVQ